MSASFIQKIKYNKYVVRLYSKIMKHIRQNMVAIDVPEVRSLGYCGSEQTLSKLRLNLLVPSVNPQDVFGGIATALSFYQKLVDVLECDSRIIVLDREIDCSEMVPLEGYQIVKNNVPSDESKQLVDMTIRTNKKLIVGDKDVFMATSWWSAYMIDPIIEWQATKYNQSLHPLIYFIQDYEPGFYPWSSRYLMAESTYKMNIPIWGIFNSKLLYDYFEEQGYTLENSWYYEPVLNENLKQYLKDVQEFPKRKKQILLYGRPSTSRNAFELIMESLREWVKIQEDVKEWTILSAGEKFSDIDLGEGIKVKSLGKLTLEEYARVMLETRVGISLMVSPHPSYPPLEMATFGIRVITNEYGNKNLSEFNENIVSIDNCSTVSIARQLNALCNETESYGKVILDGEYIEGSQGWEYIFKDIKMGLKLNMM